MRPNLLTVLALIAGTLLAFRLAMPAVAGHPLGRVLLLVVATLTVAFGAAFWFRKSRL